MLSRSLKSAIAEDAVRYVSALAQGYFGRKFGLRDFYPIIKDDSDKIGVGVRQEHYYLRFQNDGIQTFTMKSLRGKTIPMFIGGRMVFRKANHINDWAQGTKTYWRRDSQGVLHDRPGQARRWVHPGLGPKNFIEDGIQMSMDRHKADIEREENGR